MGRDRTTAFHRVGDAAMHRIGAGKRAVGRLESGGGIAEVHFELGGEIALGLGVIDGRSGVERGVTVAGGGQHVVVYQDEGGGILGNIAIIGDHDGDRFADVERLAVGHHGAVARFAKARRGKRRLDKGFLKVRPEVVERPNRMDAGHRERC